MQIVCIGKFLLIVYNDILISCMLWTEQLKYWSINYNDVYLNIINIYKTERKKFKIIITIINIELKCNAN